MFQFSSINKEISLPSRLWLVSRNSFSSKISKFGKHSSFSLGERGELAFSAIFFTAHARLMLKVRFMIYVCACTRKTGQTGLLKCKYCEIFVLVYLCVVIYVCRHLCMCMYKKNWSNWSSEVQIL